MSRPVAWQTVEARASRAGRPGLGTAHGATDVFSGRIIKVPPRIGDFRVAVLSLLGSAATGSPPAHEARARG